MTLDPTRPRRRATDNSEVARALRNGEGRAGRALELIQGFARARAVAPSTLQDADESTYALLVALADVAVAGFCDWCVIDVVDGPSEYRRLVRSRVANGESDVRVIEGELVARVPSYPALRERVLTSGRMEVWPAHHELPWCVAVGLWIDEAPYATVAFVTDEGTPGFGLAEVSAGEEVVWSIATAIERVRLRREARDAIRHSQRVASQLHQLIATSITVVGLSDTRDILLTIANRTRNVFDASEAMVSVGVGPDAVAQRALARRSRPAEWVTDAVNDVDQFPRLQEGTNDPWRDGDWLAAPILERRNHPRGMIAFRRGEGVEEGPDDEEVLALLAQMAASSLGAAELNQTLASSEARWRVLVETAPVGIIEVDPEGTIQWWNRAASSIFAWGDVARRHLDNPSFPASSLDDFHMLWADVLALGAQRSREFTEVEIRGRQRHLSVSATQLPGDATTGPRLLTLVDDITDQREMTAELRQARGREIRAQVASSIAHDFNNLLTLISGYTEMLEQVSSQNDEALTLIRDIQATTSRASQITQQLQTIGRTEAREATVVDVRRLLESNAEVIERIVGAQVAVRRSFDDGASHVLVDADQFEQVVLNLVINARDAMPDGGELIVEVSRRPPDGGESDEQGEHHVIVRVSDTGTGMDEETQRRCFEPFFTTKGPFKGTGMGLASARRFIEASGGTITVTSVLGVGTTFEIQLPATGQAPDASLATAVTEVALGSTVLVAEDDEALRRLMVQVLRRNGYRVLEGENGEEALAVIGDMRLDALVTDVDMPVIDGAELAHILQVRQPTLAVLVVSGHADESVLADLTPRTGAFLAKPFRPSELVDQLNLLLTRTVRQ